VPIDLRKTQDQDAVLSVVDPPGLHHALAFDYAATQLYKGPVKFVLSAPGHFAGVINPPGARIRTLGKRKEPPTPEEWEATTTAVPDSWWPV
jgi:polyhydroxyalkanoate synthase